MIGRSVCIDGTLVPKLHSMISTLGFTTVVLALPESQVQCSEIGLVAAVCFKLITDSTC